MWKAFQRDAATERGNGQQGGLAALTPDQNGSALRCQMPPKSTKTDDEEYHKSSATSRLGQAALRTHHRPARSGRQDDWMSGEGYAGLVRALGVGDGKV
jgi:hypothetical protein